MSEAPVSFVVGEPEPDPDPDLDPGPDPSEMQEIQDSFPGEGGGSVNLGQLQPGVVVGSVERRKRLR